MRWTPRPRLVDGSILVAVAAASATGVYSAFAGRPRDAWVIALHGIAGIALIVLLGWKLRRVRGRLARPSTWDAAVPVSVLTLLLAAATVATGFYWVHGGDLRVLAWNGLMVHVFLGFGLVGLLVFHLRNRFRFPARADVEGRRTAIQFAVLLAGSVLAWRLQQAAVVALDPTGPSRRFTGSRESGGSGNDFPVTSWVADDPDPVAVDDWCLRVDGAVSTERTLAYGDLPDGDRTRATLDCTSGWYATRDWEGFRVAQLLDAVEPRESARWVSFRSVTGYRFSLPIDEARNALLATGVDGERLSHGHGFPLRLVAPGRRGFQWVKWIESIEVRTDPDYGQWIAIFASGFSREGLPAGSDRELTGPRQA